MNIKSTTLLIIGLILGFLITQQLSLRMEIDRVTNPKTTSLISVEVAELIKNNKKLRDELATLQTQKKNLIQSADSTIATDNSLEKDLNQLKIVAGSTPISGSGISINFEKSMQLTQLVDLVNALRNIGSESLSINENRIVANTPITEILTVAPITIKAIGNSKVLGDSLLRRGGIMEQIGGAGKVTQQQEIELPIKK